MAKHHGHYCKICGEYKANEKFSGKGHASHICKQCAQLPPAAQSEQMTVNKLENMAGHSLNKAEIKYLRARLNDPRPAIKAAARETHHELFPIYERGRLQKGLTVHALEFYIHGDMFDEWGDEISVHERFSMDNTGKVRRVFCDDGSEQEINVDRVEARKFLKSIIHEMGALFWAEDLSDDDPSCGEFIDILPEYLDMDDDESDDDDEIDEEAPELENKEPIWSLQLKLSNGKECSHVFYNQMHQEPQMLFGELEAFFEDDGDFVDDWDNEPLHEMNTEGP